MICNAMQCALFARLDKMTNSTSLCPRDMKKKGKGEEEKKAERKRKRKMNKQNGDAKYSLS